MNYLEGVLRKTNLFFSRNFFPFFFLENSETYLKNISIFEALLMTGDTVCIVSFPDEARSCALSNMLFSCLILEPNET